jgi:hypothetical protein
MTRRLSITVPDKLWDELTHLEQSPSALVQRALRCLHSTEGPGAGPTPIEAAAADIPYWQSVLDNLTEQATELRAEGYEAVILAVNEGAIGLYELELVTQQYSVDELPELLLEGGDLFLRARHAMDPGENERYERGGLTLEDWDEMPWPDLPDDWDDGNELLFEVICRIIVTQTDGWLREHANGMHFRLGGGRYGGRPTADIPLSLWEGMTAAIFDTVSAVRRRVRAENNLATLGSFRQ